MRRALRFSLGPILLSFLVVPQAHARGGGGGGFGGGFGGFHGGFAGAPRGGFHGGSGVHGAIRRPGVVRNRPIAPFAARGFAFRQFTSFPNGFRNGPDIFSGWWGNGFQNGFPAWSGGGWGWPVGDWWPGEYTSQPVQQVQAPAPEPQVIVIRTDGQGRMTATEAAPDYSYVKGCHAIPNGYHCDATTETH
jgi:hypothetical protein